MLESRNKRDFIKKMESFNSGCAGELQLCLEISEVPEEKELCKTLIEDFPSSSACEELELKHPPA